LEQILLPQVRIKKNKDRLIEECENSNKKGERKYFGGLL
jgi:hypothetical protein